MPKISKIQVRIPKANKRNRIPVVSLNSDILDKHEIAFPKVNRKSIIEKIAVILNVPVSEFNNHSLGVIQNYLVVSDKINVK